MISDVGLAPVGRDRGRDDLRVERVAHGQRNRAVAGLRDRFDRGGHTRRRTAHHGLCVTVDVGYHDVPIDGIDDLLHLADLFFHQDAQKGTRLAEAQHIDKGAQQVTHGEDPLEFALLVDDRQGTDPQVLDQHQRILNGVVRPDRFRVGRHDIHDLEIFYFFCFRCAGRVLYHAVRQGAADITIGYDTDQSAVGIDYRQMADPVLRHFLVGVKNTCLRIGGDYLLGH